MLTSFLRRLSIILHIYPERREQVKEAKADETRAI